MNPTIRETCVRAGNTGFIYTLTFILFVLCGTVNLLNASDAQPASSDSVAELVNAVNELKIRIANCEARLAQYERVESIPIPRTPDSSGQIAGMHLAKENAWRKYRWTDPAQWAQITKGISQSEVIDALGNPPRWIQSMKPRVDMVYFYEIGGRFTGSKKGFNLKGQVSFKDNLVVAFKKPDFSNFHSSTERAKGH
ncbi:MAG: Uncharacterised protein [Puniceicoccaceae bacterium MED-G32]|nr:MAG: Uncharacterised protein [Puniceicoccaceae bacterium MED-G32]